MKQALDNQTELQVVAMIARGDTYEAIRAHLVEGGKPIALSTIAVIKKRNAEALAHIQGMMVQHETTTSQKILSKSRQLLERKVDQALNVDDEQAQINLDYENEEIEFEEWRARTELLAKRSLTVAELTSLSKEMFNQSQVEAGKPTSITESPAQNKAALERLLTAINNRDDVAALAEIFPEDVKPQPVS